jgi:hypothetical protein
MRVPGLIYFLLYFWGVYMPIPREDLEKLYKSMSDEEIAKQYGYSPKYIQKLRLILWIV